MDPREQLASILPTLTDLVSGIQPWQLSDPTPCSRFSVHDVIDHMIVLGGSFPYLFRGEEPPEITAPAVEGWVPVPEFRKVMEDLLDAVHRPGAMQRTVAAPPGDMAGDTFARFVAFDGLIHGWDLASSTGQSYDPPADVVAAVDEFARDALNDAMRDGDTFKASTTPPPDAGSLQQLVAFSGRTL